MAKKKSEMLKDAEKMLTEGIEKKQARMEEKAAAPKMSDETVAVLQEIVDTCGEEMDQQYADLFLKIGGAGIMEKETGKSGANLLLEFSPNDLIENGIDFRVIPTVLDSVTQRPIKGKAVLFTVTKEVEVNMAMPIMKIQEGMLLKALVKYPKDEYLRVALLAVQENIKLENESN